MKSRRLLFWVILLVFILLCIWWVLFIPFDKKSLYRAVPSNAVYVSEHVELSERWRELSANPLVITMVEQGVGISPDVLEKVRADPMAEKLFEKFAYKNTMISYTKHLPGSGRPALVVASWAGSSGQVVRWSGESGMLGTVLEKTGGIKLKKIDFDKGRRAWSWDSGNSAEYKFSIGFAEGVVVCCISPDPEAVCHVLSRISNQGSMASILRKRYSVKADDGYKDRGWVRLHDVPGAVSFVFKEDDSTGVEGWINMPEDALGLDLQKGVQLQSALQESGLHKIIGQAPGVFCAMPLSGIESVVSDEVDDVFRLIKKTASEDALAYAALLGGAFSGHLLVRVPTLLVGVQVPKDTSLPDSRTISEILDNLNKEIRTAFIPVYEEYNGTQMLVIGGTADDFYGSLKHKDKSVMAIIDGWLLFSSNKGVMKKIIDGEAGANEEPSWLTLVPSGEYAGYGWMDLESADSALESGIVAYSLMLSLNGGVGSRSTRSTLDAVRGGLKRIASLKSCRIMLKQQDSNAGIRFVLGN